MDQSISQKAEETIKRTSIEGLLIIERPTFADGRGFFRETFRKNELEAVLGRTIEFVQQNHSRNMQKGTLRGIHIAPWDKCVYAARGTVQAVLVDLREGSPTFGQHESIVIGEDRRAKIFVPAGVGNSYLVLSDEADYLYDTTDYWAPNIEKTVAYNDPDLAITWLYEGELVLSDKDKNGPTVKEVFKDSIQELHR